MEWSIVRVAIMYVFLLVVFRLTGKRSLAEATPFDLLMLLIISETTQQAMVGEDHSLTNAFLMIVTLVSLDIGLSWVKQRSETVSRLLDDLPLLLVDRGRALEERMHKSRVDKQDILEAARELAGLERFDQIKYAVLERDGRITIIPAASKPGE
jgi:uncharacterized membrane protein YcaP (DUF421 family)